MKVEVLLANEMIASINPTAATRKAVRAIILPVHPFASTVAGSGANIVPFFFREFAQSRWHLSARWGRLGTIFLTAEFLLVTLRRHWECLT